jgi:dihydroneopterin aldolase
MDYITIDNLHIRGTHGHYEHERKLEQEFVVSLKVGIDAYPAGESDALADTIDYDALHAVVENVFKGNPHYLIEALGNEIAERILAEMPSSQEVTISIQKTAVWPNGIPGVIITRAR